MLKLVIKEKKIQLLLAIFLVLIIEIFIVAKFSSNGAILNFRSLFWILHEIVVISFILMCNYVLKEEIGYYDVFLVLFPVLGIFLLLFEKIIFMKWKVKGALADEILNKKVKNRKKLEEEFEIAEFDVMNSYDLFSTNNNEKKKNFLFSYETENEKTKVEILQRALLDKNIDVIHYAATELNKIDTKIQEKIKITQKESENSVTEKEIEKNNYRLYKLYKKYIDSGLLFGEILNFYQGKCLEVLEKLNISEDEKENELLELYSETNKKEKYEELLRKKMKKSPDSNIISKYLKFLYNENRFKELLQEYNKYSKKIEKIEKPDFLGEFMERNDVIWQ